ncbi:prenyltransferase/squalene oxidase repeat-containing protein, partial [Planctomycetota bacterium]
AHFDESVTGLALLAFLGAGHTSKAGRFRNNVKRAVDWVISKQRPDGSYSTGKAQEYNEYDAAICTLALVEEYGMTRNPRIKEAAQKGVYYIIQQQKTSGGWAHSPWDSTSVLGWMVMALKSAKMAGINVPPDTFINAIKRLDSISDMDENGYPGLVGYAKKCQIIANKGLTMTAVGMLAYQFLGEGGRTERQAEMIIKHPPVWDPTTSAGSIPQNFYHWYYATLSMFQNGGGHWKTWNKGLQDTLLPNQRKGGPMDGSVNDVDGSWDPVTRYDNVGGRAYSTAMGALCLEVFYRYRVIGTHRNK